MAGRRVASQTSERNIALTILVVGSLAALASLFGNIWVVRAGVVVAIAMAAISLAVALGQIKRIREEHARDLRHERDIRAALVDRHHADSVAMIDRFNARADNLKTVIGQLRSQLAASRSELSSMRGNAVWLRAEVAERQARIEQLEARLAELEAEEHSTIIELPDPVQPVVGDIWPADEHPTIVDMRQLQLDEFEQPLRKHA